MGEIYKSILLLIHSLTQLSGISHKYNDIPTDSAADKLIEIVDNCEKKFLKVKEEIVKMVQEVENKNNEEEKISVIKTKSGFLIKEG